MTSAVVGAMSENFKSGFKRSTDYLQIGLRSIVPRSICG